MRRITLLFCLLLVQSVFSQVLQDIAINEKLYKLKNTYSIKTNDSTTLHLIVVKNKKTKKIDFLPFSLGSKFKKLNSFTFDKEPIILSHHFYKNKLIIVYKITKDNDDIYMREFDTETSKISSPKIVHKRKYKKIITEGDVTYILSFVNKYFFITTIQDGKNNSIVQYSMGTNTDDYLLKNLVNATFDYVTTNEFVEVGSLEEGHLFIDKNRLLLTLDIKKNASSYFVEFDLVPNSNSKQFVEIKQFKSNFLKVKQIRSFYIENKLFQFSLTGQEASLKILDIKTALVLNEFRYTKLNFGPYNKYFFKSKETKPNPKKFFNSFKKFRPTVEYLPTIFVVVNKSSNGGFIVESGHIDSKIYHYNNFYDWQSQWHMQLEQDFQDRVRNNSFPPDRGPNANFELVMKEKDSLRKTSFILALNKNLNKTVDIPRTVYKKGTWKDKVKYLRKALNVKNLSYTKFKDGLRYAYYNPDYMKVFIKEKK